MTEAEWWRANKPGKLLNWLRHRASERKLRLFGCACCRIIWEVIPAEGRRLVETSEHFADGLASTDQLHTALVGTGFVPTRWTGEEPRERLQSTVFKAARLTDGGRSATLVIDASKVAGFRAKCRRDVRGLFHDIFGNPFRPLPPRPEAIAPLAERIYAGEWELMPLLGEWLQEHGYWDIGEHCLDPKIQHVKGCWVVDWVTGRE